MSNIELEKRVVKLEEMMKSVTQAVYMIGEWTKRLGSEQTDVYKMMIRGFGEKILQDHETDNPV